VLAEPSVLVLASLMAGPKHGYALITDIEAQTGRRLGPGTLYGAIGRLERDGFIAPLDAQERGRRPYRITPAGKRCYEAHVEELKQYQRALKVLATS